MSLWYKPQYFFECVWMLQVTQCLLIVTNGNLNPMHKTGVVDFISSIRNLDAVKYRWPLGPVSFNNRFVKCYIKHDWIIAVQRVIRQKFQWTKYYNVWVLRDFRRISFTVFPMKIYLSVVLCFVDIMISFGSMCSLYPHHLGLLNAELPLVRWNYPEGCG